MKKNIVLIDFENVQPKDLGQLRGRPFITKIFCGANQSKVSLDLAAELQPLGQDAEYVRIAGSGRNALDFHIAYYIGRLSTEFPDGTFYVISKDAGFDPLIQHLKKQSITCQRLQTLGDVPGLGPQPASPSSERVMKVVGTLLKQKESRPRKVKTLTAFIKGQVNDHADDANIELVIAQLSQSGVKMLPDGKVAYPAE